MFLDICRAASIVDIFQPFIKKREKKAKLRFSPEVNKGKLMLMSLLFYYIVGGDGINIKINNTFKLTPVLYGENSNFVLSANL